MEVVPTSVAEALGNPCWVAAMRAEIRALIANRTWSLVSLPVSTNIVDYRWVFRIKRQPDGSIDRFKARLISQGYTQCPDIDSHETYNPVLKPVTIRTVFSIALSQWWPILQFDVNNVSDRDL
ncbi:unnamed protein product [Linum trigynum]|uniref:Reverse transcriptase Ty1/copia-type domain-containing protein n=1 Tax=Linum trigynum TaxID=586398 RepID=A0AAV2GKX9_9ROSI